VDVDSRRSGTLAESGIILRIRIQERGGYRVKNCLVSVNNTGKSVTWILNFEFLIYFKNNTGKSVTSTLNFEFFIFQKYFELLNPETS
jgi:hypothetical protein